MKQAAEISDCASAPNKRLAARREAFLSAGRDVFNVKGYADATLDDVIAKSGGSRQTLYALFGGKQGLFEAIVKDNCETIYRGMTLDVMASRAPAEVLEEVGMRYITIVTSPECLSLNRMIIAEAPRMPELAERFWRFGPGFSRDFLTAFFNIQIKQGNLRLADAHAASDQFLEMMSGTLRMKCLLGLRPAPAKAEIKKIAKGAVAQFLDGCRTKADQAMERSYERSK